MFNIRFLVDNQKIKRYFLKRGVKNVPKGIFLETEKFKKTIESKWNKKESVILTVFRRITGIKLEGKFVVSVLHPSLEIAQYNDKQNIEWGYDELYPNYIIIGLSHELLHCLTHDFYITLTDGQKWVFHAIIYLSINEKLRFKLNGESNYFSMPRIETYHKRLIKIAKNILPYFLKYTTENRQKNIFDFYNSVRKMKIG